MSATSMTAGVPTDQITRRSRVEGFTGATNRRAGRGGGLGRSTRPPGSSSLGTYPPSVDIKVSERLAHLCDIRLEGGPEGFSEELAERERDEVEEILAEAVDALLDAEEQHKRDVRQIAERLGKRSST
jgi:hypothetical protein